jgi:acyl-CoA thioester hydrolase
MPDKYVEETLTVELSDTDMTRFIHFASVVRYFEVGLRLVMDEAGITFRELFDRRIGLPIVNVECDYQNPMFYGDELTLQTSVDELSEKTMTLDIRLLRDDTITAKGALTVSFYEVDEKKAISAPEDIRTSLKSI